MILVNCCDCVECGFPNMWKICKSKATLTDDGKLLNFRSGAVNYELFCCLTCGNAIPNSALSNGEKLCLAKNRICGD